MRTPFIALLLVITAPVDAAVTMKFFNGTSNEVDVVWQQLSPAPGPSMRAILEPEERLDTKIEVGDEVYSVAFQRKGKDVVRPVIGTGFEIAMLLEPRGRPVYVALRPPDEARMHADVGDAMNLGGEKRPSSLYCIPVHVRQWNGKRVAVLANGLFLELSGSAAAGVAEGRRCFCGRGVTGRERGLDIFEAGSTCPLLETSR